MTVAFDVIVIGGGLSGLMAGLTAAERGLSTLVLDRNPGVGGKYCYTSMGAAALTNTGMGLDRFHGRDIRFVTDALSAFDAPVLRGWFEEHGVQLADAEYYGLVCPPSGGDAVGALVEALESTGAELRTECVVTGVERVDGGFRVQAGEPLQAKSVVLAAGGANLPQLGGGDDGYRIAVSLGHQCEPAYAAHAGVTVAETWPTTLPGLWMDVELSLTVGCKPLRDARAIGSMLFTQSGLTGEAVFNISRYIGPNLDGGPELHVNFHPGMEFDDVAQWLHRVFGERTREPSDRAIDFMLPASLGSILLAHQKVKPGARVMQLHERQRQGLLTEMVDTRLRATGTLGMRAAESCSGGVQVREVDPRTMQSKLVPGLYVVGRLLDICADWGGFEQHFSLASGRLAGLSVLQ
ncbi:MAG: aminoacetone oxidase family FAD-binding enzyme [Planctomycetes bacterium]|nr:aminoacetone oxidase family FAD-binding enzyme [Planctomycetota bacterium]